MVSARSTSVCRAAISAVTAFASAWVAARLGSFIKSCRKTCSACTGSVCQRQLAVLPGQSGLERAWQCKSYGTGLIETHLILFLLCPAHTRLRQVPTRSVGRRRCAGERAFQLCVLLLQLCLFPMVDAADCCMPPRLATCGKQASGVPAGRPTHVRQLRVSGGMKNGGAHEVLHIGNFHKQRLVLCRALAGAGAQSAPELHPCRRQPGPHSSVSKLNTSHVSALDSSSTSRACLRSGGSPLLVKTCVRIRVRMIACSSCVAGGAFCRPALSPPLFIAASQNSLKPALGVKHV